MNLLHLLQVRIQFFIKTEDGGENWDRIFKAEKKISKITGFGYIDENKN